MRITTILATALTVLTCSVSSWAADRIATAGDAYIARDEAAHTWIVANLSVSATFQIDRGRESRLLHLTNVVTGHAWETASASDTETTIAGHQSQLGASDARYQLVDVIATSTDLSVHLTLAFDHRDTHLRVTRHYVVYAGVPAIETWTRFETQAGGDVEVSDLNVWNFTVTGSRSSGSTGCVATTSTHRATTHFRCSRGPLRPASASTLAARRDRRTASCRISK